MSPEERQEVVDKEKLILDAAMDEFVAEGWGGARMQSIADRAGINKTLLHYYFRSKEKLYERTLYMLGEFFFGEILGAVSDYDDFEDFLKAFITSIIDNAAENPRIPMFIMQELSRGGKAVSHILGEILLKKQIPLTQVMIGKIQKAMMEGKIIAMNPVQFILSLIGSSLYFFMAEPIIMKIGILSGQMEDFDRKAFLEQRKKDVFTMLYYGMKKREDEK